MDGILKVMTDVFGKFRKMCLKSYHLNPAISLRAPGLSWQAALKTLKLIRIIN